jgi:hypothetical protein
MAPSSHLHPVTHNDLVELRDQLIATRVDLVERMDKEGARIDGLFAEHDVRYGQRFDAQGEALEAARTAAEKAVAAALAAAEKASAFAQASADRAVTKAETAADERFKMFGEKIDELTRVVNLSAGAGSGLKAGWAYLVGGLAVISIIYNIFRGMHP